MNKPEFLESGAPAAEVAARLLVQRGVFVGMSPIVNDDLYVAFRKGSGDRERHTLRLDAGARAHTNTYFGRFAASYWQRWTTVTEVRVSLRAAGSGRFRVRLVASDIAGHRRIVGAVAGSGDETVELSSPLDKFVDGGALWVEIDALDAPLTVDRLEWTAAAPETVRPVAIAICTFNRADDCAKTVAALASDDRVLEVIDSVYVVDQGTDLVRDRELYGEVAPRFGDKLHYLRQPNLGGAGGFTRGLYEVSAADGHADVILMDDDILCEPETVLRLNAFANVTVEPTLVGAQMLFLLNPDYLNVGAEDVDLGTLQHGQKVPKALRNTSMLKKNQERRVDAGYNAWWTCLIPAEVVAKVGLPVPIFFQWDDVEYGVRAREAGFVTVTLPNAAVWHADFYWKDFDDWARYFSTRNSLIVGALHSDLDTKRLGRQFFRQISEYLVGMQYGLAATTLRGIEDFLEGPKVLQDGGIAAMAAIRAERAEYQETVKHDAATAPVRSADLTTRRSGGEPSAMRLILIKRAIDQWFGRTQHGLVSVPREDAHWWHISLFDHVVVTDASQSGVRIRQRDKGKAVDLLRRTVRVLRRLREDGAAVSRQYRDAAPQLTSRENWERLYEQ
ncbi:galactofuranosylgalactofuranosylrhamnosyl-N-acetylglucosaminyl-diphospho-decaprenol beta-1,5/1,6-galactofuranosyltransferase [Rhodococcus sp. PvR044]|jgi:galactofuranosylgalactofuranosylrhamnosyl-N-acetylglucosaminyl-diphospho-decaprenol beta-1,5/1,6-galactofuranosyltransferase|uniref:glycosyltransferase n=1 Tax=Rhodococcus TaxID=1827 RepID=UPI000BDCEA97|nr:MULTISPECIES: glycosyltransferase [Rhodococcus]MBP1161179.1 galactofuranosylgalactofuranosylrhamnosyl-N-acetylglucosaminyl-diphospho-decaprenol beta-1,5/1,6-galactofuranosyltransferase [Rhodococcus sp. PvR099]MCZ4557640.1 glycosyltransferase [Rhodococcus maanshanensis]PTR39573.1 galactofuranosylgalactofuranosylrhamnosyl-N-acetylglucosaminyl-diphospho-decaprenol beta-1,5/1,6-galactofuranosyltransferase [Rhodococcus sp. OK611]SNX92724.1 galactofuranosylgalactofuranosylrhamnosyl-N-acetylglucosa